MEWEKLLKQILDVGVLLPESTAYACAKRARQHSAKRAQHFIYSRLR